MKRLVNLIIPIMACLLVAVIIAVLIYENIRAPKQEGFVPYSRFIEERRGLNRFQQESLFVRDHFIYSCLLELKRDSLESLRVEDSIWFERYLNRMQELDAKIDTAAYYRKIKERDSLARIKDSTI